MRCPTHLASAKCNPLKHSAVDIALPQNLKFTREAYRMRH